MNPNASAPAERRPFGRTTIEVANDEFFNAFQVGNLLFRTRPQEPLTESALYTFLWDTLRTDSTDRHKAGAISGWFAALYGYHIAPVVFPQPAVVSSYVGQER